MFGNTSQQKLTPYRNQSTYSQSKYIYIERETEREMVISIKIQVSITILGWPQEGHPVIIFPYLNL